MYVNYNSTGYVVQILAMQLIGRLSSISSAQHYARLPYSSAQLLKYDTIDFKKKYDTIIHHGTIIADRYSIFTEIFRTAASLPDIQYSMHSHMALTSSLLPMTKKNMIRKHLT